MASIHDELSEQFTAFLRRGNGWAVHPHPVEPEPPFLEFSGYKLKPVVDDGRIPTAGSHLLSRISALFGNRPSPPQQPSKPPPELAPSEYLREEIEEIQIEFPQGFDVKGEVFTAFLSHLGVCRDPVSFELIGRSDRVTVQFACSPVDVPQLRRQLSAFFPELPIFPTKGYLDGLWDDTGPEAAVVEFGFCHGFISPLPGASKLDPYVGIVSVLSELGLDELAILQAISVPVRNDWRGSILRAVTNDEGRPTFANRPDFIFLAKEKTAVPLHATVFRLATRAETFERAWDILRDLAFALRPFEADSANLLVPLRNDNYPHSDHLEDVRKRQSRRSGMILNSRELASIVHFPSSQVRSTKLRRQTERTKLAPPIVHGSQNALVLGQNSHQSQSVTVGLNGDQRSRHMHIVGASGTGKSTLLLHLIQQDLENGEGIAVLDPHGDLVESVLRIIPKNRVDDVVFVDPADEEFSIGFNILSAHSDLERNLLASDLVSVFRRLSTSWGDQMGSVLQNAILAFLSSSRGGTIADLRRFLLEKPYRDSFLQTVTDPEIVYYWQKGFAQLSGNKSIGPVLTRLETFLSPKAIRYMVSQKANRLDFANIIDTGKILLAKLPQGQLGQENSFLLGSLLVSKFQQLAMSRQAQRADARRPFYLYIDEFQNFITPTMAEILSGARKYRLGLILAHQELHQLERDRDVASAVLSNPYTRIVFRVSDSDARTLGDGFEFFTAKDIQSLGTGRAICRVERSSNDFNLAIPPPIELKGEELDERARTVIANSRRRYGTPRAKIEAELYGVPPTKGESAPTPPPEESKPEVRAKPKSAPPTSPSPPAASVLIDALIDLVAPPEKAPQPEGPPIPPEIQKPPPVPAAKEVKPSPPSGADPSPVAPKKRPTAGRGGTEHKELQRRFQTLAHELGYKVTIEMQIPGGREAVDIVFERGGITIACEITLTQPVEAEVGNLLKCLKAGLPKVALVSPSSEKLKQVEEAILPRITSEDRSKLLFLTPDKLEGLLCEPGSILADPKEDTTIRRGYRVKRTVVEISPEERKAREDAAIQSISDALQKKKRRKKPDP